MPAVGCGMSSPRAVTIELRLERLLGAREFRVVDQPVAERRPINLYAGGEAFERARLAADKLELTIEELGQQLRSISHGEVAICSIGRQGS